jgi:hypothetical protein
MPARLTVISALAAAGLVAAALAAATAVQAARAPADVELLVCERSDLEGLRSAAFQGRMRAVPGTGQMWMRFALLEQTRPRSFTRVAAPGLRGWRKSRRGVGSFTYRQRVVGLRSGRAYRMLVRFRWYNARGELIRRERRRSDVCGEPQPNLQIESVEAWPGPTKDTAVYAVTVLNAGRFDARKVVVSFAIDGAEVDTKEVDFLLAGESAELRFTGPLCRRSFRAVADPRNTVGETREDDNIRDGTCAELTDA